DDTYSKVMTSVAGGSTTKTDKDYQSCGDGGGGYTPLSGGGRDGGGYTPFSE
ncbi:hypothetical protein HAX54_006152, partial [Datura stramonium]|nr:hypothetical protein [Datura stramonium]